MKRKLLCLPIYFLLTFTVFARENDLYSQPETTSIAQEQTVQEKKSIFTALPRRIESDFYLTSNFSGAFGFNFTTLDSGNGYGATNYPYLKLNIDLMEAWFNRLGVASVLGFNIGFDPNHYSTIICQLICPGLNFSWDFGAGLYLSAGINLLHTWYYYSETETFAPKTISGGILTDGESVSYSVVSTIRSYGVSIPVKLRYAFSTHFTIFGEYIFAFHPSTPSDNRWIVENTFDAGVSFSLPVNF